MSLRTFLKLLSHSLKFSPVHQTDKKVKKKKMKTRKRKTKKRRKKMKRKRKGEGRRRVASTLSEEYHGDEVRGPRREKGECKEKAK